MRTAKITRRVSGAFETILEASNLGVRFCPEDYYLQLRLRQIINRCYPDNSSTSLTKLAWLLRRYEGSTTEEGLNSALTTESPLLLVEKLVLADQETFTAAARELRLRLDSMPTMTDEELARY